MIETSDTFTERQLENNRRYRQHNKLGEYQDRCKECDEVRAHCLCGLTCEERGFECEMEVKDTVSDFHDPSQSHGHGQIEGKVLVCKWCGREEEYEKDEPEESDL